VLTKTVRVEVTAEDIASGVRKDCSCCPVAIALGRALALDGRHVAVGWEGATIQASPDAEEHTVKFEDAVGQWMRRFDQGCQVEPFAFDLNVPTEALTC
jgi:hypothetical protein